MDESRKTCSKCGEVRSLDEYSHYMHKGLPRPMNPCKPCKRSGQRVLDYGVSDTDYQAMFIAQNGVCFLCQEPERMNSNQGKTRGLSVDHNHESGKVRHLLCGRCNLLVGHVENAGNSLLGKTIRYIEDHRNNIYGDPPKEEKMQDINDIEAAIDEFEDGWGELAYVTDEAIEGILGLVSGVEHVGGEGQGEYTHVVFKIVNDGVTRHFKKVGCRVSHSGTYWDGPFTEVTQKQKVVTVWE